MKERFLVRRLKQAISSSACEFFESYHLLFEHACEEFDIVLFNARLSNYVLVEICEIGDDDDYHPIKCVKLEWL